MRYHDHDSGEYVGEPVRRRPVAEEAGPSFGAALAAGRPDALGPAGLLHLQRMAGNAGVGALMEDEDRSPVHDVISSGGQALDTDTRTEMEARLGHDFSDVRVHIDDAAHASAQSVAAHAYTVGNNVVFQRDSYDPSSQEGKTTLAHELTHVVQQRSGPVDGTPQAGGVSVSDPSDRFEREAAANAEHVMAGPALSPATGAADGAAVQSVQRQEEPEEEPEEEPTLQGTFVQRCGPDHPNCDCE
ncbi:MAG: DUF4157 domain-containing protein [Streptosporangiales bacterium]|nr:DUF4157 domain-containing protein [Streptosporangiales bacterium]